MVRRIALEAGLATLAYFDESGCSCRDVATKDDGSPVTIADREAEEIIERRLREILPTIPIIGEEAAADGKIPDLTDAAYFWLVDPLDGTKEFISGDGDYTVNIALIHKDTPVMGVVYAPARGELYAGHAPDSAVRWREDTGSEKPIHVRHPPKEGLTVVASRSHGDQERLEEFLEGHKVEKLLKHGSSLKICAVAAGKADVYPRFGPTCEWDTAAGDAILRAAGGLLKTPEGEPLTYGHANRKFVNPAFIAAPVAFFET